MAMIKDCLFDCANSILTIIAERQDGSKVSIQSQQSSPAVMEQLATDLPVFLDSFSGDSAYWSSGVFTEFPEKPSGFHEWNWATKQWEDPRTLDDLKAAKWEAMKAARDAAEKSTFVWNGHIVDADMARLNGAATSVMIAQAQGYGYSDTWTLADNSTLPVSGADILEMGLALAAHVSACHARGRALRQQILACTTKEQVDAIEWSLP